MAEVTTDYLSSGVNRAAADTLVERIAAMTGAKKNARVKASVGGYASLFALDSKRWIAASTDGVGTKLKLAFDTGIHNTVGLDLVAMSVNDLLCVGAEPLFFLDYFATGKLELGTAEKVLQGIVEGCRQAGCALVGGETAEMPGFYNPGEYDLAGFAVGIVNPKDVLPRRAVKPGDAIIGIASSGLHSNGFSLARQWLPGAPKGTTEELLKPTLIYAQALKPMMRFVKGLAHITGSGFLNVPRISEKVSYELSLPPLRERAPIYPWIYSRSNLGLSELAQTFNLGVGMVAVVDRLMAKKVLGLLKKQRLAAWVLGQVVKRRSGEPSRVSIEDPDHPDRQAQLVYV